MEARLEAVLWDNDGVLVDTEPLYLRANQEILATVGIELTVDAFREVSLQHGRSVFELAVASGCDAREISRLRVDRDRRYAELLDEGVNVLAGVRESLDILRGRLPMAIVTSSQKTHFDRIHRQTSLLDYFEFVLANGDYERHKPHPDPYLAAAARLGVAPERCLAIEDTERGLRSAVAAGMRCVVIPRELSRASDFRSAHRVLETAQDVAPEVEALLGCVTRQRASPTRGA